MDWISQFIELLFPINSNQINFDAAYSIKDKHIPPSIFKFRSFENPKHIDNLINDSIWLSSPSNFNDPYDSSFSINWGNLTKIINKKSFPDFLETTKYIDEIPPEIINSIKQSDNPYDSFIEYLCERDSINPELKNQLLLLSEITHKEHIKDINERFLNAIRNSFKICSFTTNINSTLLWSHYAKNHTGFCIEYNLTMFSKSDHRRRFLYPVIYREQLLDVECHDIVDGFSCQNIVDTHELNLAYN